MFNVFRHYLSRLVSPTRPIRKIRRQNAISPMPSVRPRVQELEPRLAPASLGFSDHTYSVKTGPDSVVMTADVNGDGTPDFVFSSNYGNQAFLSNGNGTFAKQATFSVKNAAYLVAVADVNGDGKPDAIALSGRNPGVVAVGLGNGNGSFQTAKSFTVGTYASRVAVADLNGDGKPDLVVSNSGPYPSFNNTISVLLGNGDGTFKAAKTYTVGSQPTYIAVADYNGDGKPDLAVACPSSNSISILTGNGNGTFKNSATISVGTSSDLITTDVNGDGIADLICTNFSSSVVKVLLGNGNGTFKAAKSFGVDTGPEQVAVGDFNGDGRLDLATVNQSLADVSILLGNGDGTFKTQKTFAIGLEPNSIASADFNGDGRTDLVVSNFEDNTVEVLQNTTVFPPTTTITSPTSGDDNATSWPGSISGTVTDSTGPGVASVRVSIFNGTNYWNGTAFGSSSQVFNNATLSGSTWSYAFPASNLTSGTTYTIQSKGTDTSGNVETPSAGNTVLYDAVAPTSTITSPTAGTYNVAGWANSISGTVSDTGGSGVTSVGVSIYNGTDYWTGTTFSSANPVFNTITPVGGNWSYAFPSANLSSGTTYTVQSEATDAADNVETPSAGVQFLFASYTLSGNVFYDLTGSGNPNGEPGEPGVTVYLDTNNNGVLDTGEPNTTTDLSGNFNFTDLIPGSYNLREVVPAASTETTPVSGVSVVNLTGNSSGNEIGNRPFLYTAVSGSTLQIIGDDSAQAVTLELEPGGNTLDIFSSGTLFSSFAVSSYTSIAVTLNGGNDFLTINDTNGNPIPAGGLTYNGGAGANSLYGPNSGAVYTVTGADSGTVSDGITFSNVGNLQGGTGNDSFVLAGGSLSGSITGGGGNDTLDLSATTGSNTWNITGANQGTVGGLPFVQVAILIGGSGTDDFVFGSSGSLSGSIDGKGGINTVDDSAVVSPVTVQLSALANIQTLIGGASANDTLVGTSSATTWNITGANSGTVGGTAYSAFENLTGGTGADTFTLSSGGSEVFLDGGAGSNTFLVQGGAYTSITDSPSTSSGTLALTSSGGTSSITYQNVSVQITPTSVTSLTFNLASSAGTVSLEDDGTGGNNVSQLRSLGTAFSTVTFTDPTNLLTVNFLGGDTVQVNGLDSQFGAALTLSDGGAGSSAVSLNSPLTLGSAGIAGNLSVTAAAVAVNASVTASNGGTIILTGPVTVGALATLSATTVTFAGTVDDTTVGSHTLTVSGNADFQASVGSLTTLNGLLVNGTSTLNGSVITTGTQTYSGAVILNTNPTLTGTTVTFGRTLDDVLAGFNTLTVSGNVSFQGAVGGVASLNALSVSGTVSLGASVNTSNAQTYTGAVALTGSATLTASAGGNITFGSSVDGAFDLTVNTAGITSFAGLVGSGTALSSLGTNAAGSTQLTAGSVTTTGTQTYSDTVTLVPAITNLTASTVTFGGALPLGTSTVNVTGSLALTAGATLSTILAGTATTQYGHLTRTGTANLGGATLVVTLQAGFTPPANTTFDLVGFNSTGALSGTFANLPDQSEVNPGLMLLTYKGGSGGNDAVLRVASPIVVTTTADVVNPNDGVTSLREAINQANSNPGTDVITFDIPGSGVQTINLTSALPGLSGTVVIDGTTQPGYSSTPLIELKGTSAGSGASGLVLSGGNSTVRGLVIDGFGNNGIQLASANNVVAGNYIGTNAAGNAASANGNYGIFVTTAGNRIGGVTAADRNVISGNAKGGVVLSGAGATGNVVEGNYVGTNFLGTYAVANTNYGVYLTSAGSNTVGGTGAGAGNVISGTNGFGFGIELSGSATAGNLIAGNDIGTDAAGTGKVANTASGIDANGAGANTIGVAGAGNVISGNLVGIHFEGGSAGGLVQGNFIGTTGGTNTAALANGNYGILIAGATNVTLGGTAAGTGNVISGNGNTGVYLSGSGTSGTVVEGNYIGTNAAGTAAVANGYYGVQLLSAGANNTIGGSVAGARNVISGNGNSGVLVQGGSGSVIAGNYIGTNAAGTAKVANTDYGIILNGAGGNTASGNTIGGSSFGSGGNLISGNSRDGIFLNAVGASGNTIEGNYVGTDVTGTAAIANSLYGVFLSGAGSNTVGGTAAGAGNVISGNTNSGLQISSPGATNNLIAGNFIGTNAAGTAAVANGSYGLNLASAGANTVGGTTTGARNVISGNVGAGIELSGSAAKNNVIEGNYVGTDVTGLHKVANAIGIEASGAGTNTIGGSVAGAGNLISGNTGVGIHLFGGSTGLLIAGNDIGTDSTGAAALSNGTYGLFLSGATNVVIGGTTSLAANVISGNANTGIYLSGSTTSGNLIEGNFIGTTNTGAAGPAVANGVYGVRLDSGAHNNTIGSTAAGAGNTIGDNGTNGVLVSGSTTLDNAILADSIFSNGGVGISLLGGGNNAELAPSLTAASYNTGTGTLSVSGTVSGTVGAHLTLEFFSSPSSGAGQGQTYLGSATVIVGSGGTGTFTNQTFVTGLTAKGQFITATATDPNNNTSAFSGPLVAS